VSAADGTRQNLDHFTHNIIRNELKAITATPAPNPIHWAFSPENDLLFATKPVNEEERISPDEWISKGLETIQGVLSMGQGPYLETQSR
jgi:ion channel-forming bestrophin family protein